MHKELILAKFKTVEEMSILAQSLTTGQHFDAAVEVTSRLQKLIADFKEELAVTVGDLEDELETLKLSASENEVHIQTVTSTDIAFVGFNQPADGVEQVPSDLTVSAPVDPLEPIAATEETKA